MYTILHPTDFSVDSEQAFRMACGIARDQMARMLVQYVIDGDRCSDHDRRGDELLPESRLYQSNLIRFEQLQAQAYNIPISFHIKIGSAIESIVNFALQEACDLIVLAARYHDSLIYEIHSSVSVCVISLAHCPVLCLSQPNEFAPHVVPDQFGWQFQDQD
ncbi:MAG: universal stress protein [Planctomycetes bacterium]|nr:universal stress protein [Planctomycetota bacterium]